MSYPFYGEEFTFTQPDGTTIKVKGWGDQYYAVFEAVDDGYTVVKDPTTGFYSYAELSSDKQEYVSSGVQALKRDPNTLNLERHIRIPGPLARQKALDAYRFMGSMRRCEIRRERRRRALLNAMLGVGPTPLPPAWQTRGEYTGLCILIDFPEVEGDIERDMVDNFCNQEGYSEYGNNGSVYDYFLDNSNSLLEYKNIVPDYYTAKQLRQYYTNPNVDYGIRARELVKEAIIWLKDYGFDFRKLSSDDEGYIYAISVFYAGGRVNNWSEGLWPHAWHLAAPLEVSEGLFAYDYQITNMGNELSLATFVHENGHMLCDFPDLYDYGYESKGAGLYCVMSHGGKDKKNPTEVCAYLKQGAGWGEAKEIAHGLGYSIGRSSKNRFYLYRNPDKTREYFILEGRWCSGRDESLPASGLAIWHVDEDGSNNHEQMHPEKHYECSLEQSDGRFDLESGEDPGDEGDLYPNGKNKTFSPRTSPGSQWWSGDRSGLVIKDISSSEEAIKFSVEIIT